MNETPAAAIAPAMMAGHWKCEVRAGATSPTALMSMHAKERKDGHDDDYKANEINDAIHVSSLHIVR